MAVPTIYKKLIEEYEKEELDKKADEIKRKFKHLRLMVSGSSALPESLFKRWKEISGHPLPPCSKSVPPVATLPTPPPIRKSTPTPPMTVLLPELPTIRFN